MKIKKNSEREKGITFETLNVSIKYVAGKKQDIQRVLPRQQRISATPNGEIYKELHLTEELKLYYQEQYIKSKDKLSKSIACECGRILYFWT